MPKNVIVAFTDGSCYNNGQVEKEQWAGIGVYYPGFPSHNLSEDLPFVNKTNNRAELYAIIRCLENILSNPQKLPLNRKTVVLIKSDSLLCIKSVTEWFDTWKSNHWLKSNKKPVENKELLLRLDALLEVFPYRVQFEHVRGHTKEPKDKKSTKWFDWFGNMMSDKLAGDASRAARTEHERIQQSVSGE